MNNSIILILANFLLFLSSTHSNAQFEGSPIDKNQNLVISTNGLSIRSRPTLKSKKLGVVPFGKKVIIENDKSYGWDTIGLYKSIWGKSYDSENDYPITGHWVKAKYGNISGYMFSAYLYYETNGSYSDEPEYLKNLNKDFAILFPGLNCYSNINFSSKMKWYGVYQEDGIYHLKKTSVSFFRAYSELLDFGISTNDNKSLLFIIGSEKPLNEKILEGLYWKRFGDSFYQYTDQDFQALLKYGIQVDPAKYGFSITLKSLEKSQLLNPNDAGISHAIAIQWVGDLDDDGKLDFILHYGEKNGQTILYLSSEANKNEIVKPVAAYFSGYCC